MIDFVEICGRRLYVGAVIQTRDGREGRVAAMSSASRGGDIHLTIPDYPGVSGCYWNATRTREDGSLIYGGAEGIAEYPFDIVSWENPKLTKSGKISINV